MRVLLSGYYGFGNFGDEALLDVIVRRLRARFPRAELEVLSAVPESTSRSYGVLASPRWPWREVRQAVARADVVLSGGGGLLQNATSLRSLLYYAGVIREAVRVRRKTMVFAQSIGPLDTLGRLVVRRFCRGLACATVRDERSRSVLQALVPQTPVERTADPVFLYDPGDAEADLSAEGLGPESGPYAVVSVRKVPALKHGVATIARAVDRLAREHGIRPAFLPLGGPGDAEASTTVIRACTSAPVLVPECSPAKTAAILRGARVVVGMRLHALILAARFGVPFLAVPYDPKVASLCDELRYPLPPLWMPGAEPPDGPQVDAAVDQLIARYDVLSAHLSARADGLREAAERNFDVLADLVRDGSTSQGETETLP